MKESVNEFIVYNKFVTGPSSTQQTFFMEMRNALRAAFISPESNDNLTRTIAALPAEKYIFGRDAHFQHFRVIHTANIFLIWPVIRPVSVFFLERHTVQVVLLHDVIDACHVHKLGRMASAFTKPGSTRARPSCEYLELPSGKPMMPPADRIHPNPGQCSNNIRSVAYAKERKMYIN